MKLLETNNGMKYVSELVWPLIQVWPHIQMVDIGPVCLGFIYKDIFYKNFKWKFGLNIYS
jgi:hypothetical protein